LKKAIFVTGTDTGVGKTIFSLLLMQYLYAEGFDPFYLKPAQTGCIDPYDEDSDARFIYRHVPHLRDKDPADSVIYCLKNPKAPYFAARDEDARIDIDVISHAVIQKIAAHSHLIVEGAGGLMVPLNGSLMMIDLIELLNAVPLVVARAGLGTINHTLLTLELLHKRGITVGGVVFMDPADPPVSEEMVRENMEAVEKFSGVPVCGVIGRVNDFYNPDKSCYKPFDRISILKA
jgi:dethiobiotin synthetase